MKYKVAFKGDGTKETGEKIIAALKRLGGVNTKNWNGNSNYYYFIKPTNNAIDYDAFENVQYRNLKIVPLESTQKLFKLL